MNPEDLHEQVEQELRDHEIKADLWQKAMSQSGNDKMQARQLYKTYRLMQLQRKRAERMRHQDEYEVEAEEVPESTRDERPNVTATARGRPDQSARPPAGESNALAMTALVLGILGMGCCGCLTGLPAIICGHVALGKIKRGEAPATGKVLAIVGIVLGWLSLAISVGAFMLGLVGEG